VVVLVAAPTILPTILPAVLVTGCGRSGPARLSPPVPLEQLDMTPYVSASCNALLEVTADYGGVRSAASSDPCLDADTMAFEIIQQIRSGNP
jgi:hypothetical protein